MAQEKRILRGYCPNCKASLEYESGEEVVTCYSCDTVIEKDSIIKYMTDARTKKGTTSTPIASTFHNPQKKSFTQIDDLIQLENLKFKLCKTENGYDLKLIDGSSVSPTPLISGITSILSFQKGTLYVIIGNRSICSYQMTASTLNEEKGLKTIFVCEEGKYFVPMTKNEYFFESDDGNDIFLKCDFIPQRVLGDKKKDKKNIPEKILENQYTILDFDIGLTIIEQVVPELIDIIAYTGKRFIYRYAEKGALEKVGRKKVKASIDHYICSTIIEEKKQKKLFPDSYHIEGIVNDQIIYTKWSPNPCNLDLYKFDLFLFDQEEECITQLDHNIYRFLSIKGNTMFYTVGSQDGERIYSLNLKDNVVRELTSKAVTVEAYQDPYVYYFYGEGRNRILFKQDVEKKEESIQAEHITSLVNLMGDYVYFINYDGDLQVTDGYETKTIVHNYSKENSLFVDEDAIHYVANELVGYKNNEPYYVRSFYRMDLDGKNLKKVFFNLRSVTRIDIDTFYFVVEEEQMVKVTVPGKKDTSDVSFITLPVSYYYSFNTTTEEASLMLLLSAPTEQAFQVTSGLGIFRKLISKKKTFAILPKEKMPKDQKEFKREQEVVELFLLPEKPQERVISVEGRFLFFKFKSKKKATFTLIPNGQDLKLEKEEVQVEEQVIVDNQEATQKPQEEKGTKTEVQQETPKEEPVVPQENTETPKE